ncbi:MAG: penicillin-binding transpeptidase domain-containing protein [Planctomycetota bacterium]|jgi:penicillin-binding protein 2
MFERRLKILLLILAVPTVALIARLVQLQIKEVHLYRDDTERLLYLPPRYFPFIRGDITDQAGIRLAYDAPAWEVCVDYGVLEEDEFYLDRLERDWPSPDKSIEERIEESWWAIEVLTGKTRADLEKRRKRIINQVRRWKADVSKRHGRSMKIKEERSDRIHAVVGNLDQGQMADARQYLAAYPWVEVIPSYTRQYRGGEPVGHLLGRLGQVSRKDIDNDPNGDDPLAEYWSGDLRGVSGVEALGEHWLRGRRGMVHVDKEGRTQSDPVEPEPGKTFRLSIDLELQSYVYQRLMEAIEANSVVSGGTITGGSAVILDIGTRQALAMVSCPSFDPGASWEERRILEKDKLRRPYLFRALREHYPPGSTVKPMVLACALQDKKVHPQENMVCNKYMFPDVTDKWRCLNYHYDVDPITAVQKSCNIFFYHVGERMRVDRLSFWMLQFGLGRSSGIGMAEAGDSLGDLPTKGGKGDARRMAIGQYQVVTPVQAANMVATIASGRYRPVTIWADDRRPREAVELPISKRNWRIAREGMYRVVNEPGGTAYGPEKADFYQDPDFVMLGKTGSAELVNRDETHAWFVGYLASRAGYLEDADDSEMNIALAVILEFGGHGGRVASPVAGDIVRFILNRYRGLGDTGSQEGQES